MQYASIEDANESIVLEKVETSWGWAGPSSALTGAWTRIWGLGLKLKIKVTDCKCSLKFKFDINV